MTNDEPEEEYVDPMKEHQERWRARKKPPQAVVGGPEKEEKKETKKEKKPRKKKKKGGGGAVYVSPQFTLDMETRVEFDRNKFSKRDYEEFMDPEKLKEARIERERIIAYYGFVPRSILPFTNAERDKALDDLVDDQLGKGTYDDRKSNPDHLEGTKYKNDFRGLSQFSPRVADFVIKKWGVKGGTMLDVCNERLPRLLVANHLGMNVVGYDIWNLTQVTNAEKMRNRINSARALNPDDNEIYVDKSDPVVFEAKYKGTSFKFYEKDNRHLHLDDNGVDAVFTSPPYWSVERYGEEEEQLGNVDTYDEFLDNIRLTLAECYRVIKKDAFITWDVANFRHNGFFYAYTPDSVMLLREAGFKIHDIVHYTSGDISAIFARTCERGKIAAKVHTSLIVGRKVV